MSGTLEHIPPLSETNLPPLPSLTLLRAELHDHGRRRRVSGITLLGSLVPQVRARLFGR